MKEKKSARDTSANSLTSISYFLGSICGKSADYFQKAKDSIVGTAEKKTKSASCPVKTEKSAAKKKAARYRSRKTQKRPSNIPLNPDFEDQIEQIRKKIE